jgi:hypothetical protein
MLINEQIDGVVSPIRMTAWFPEGDIYKRIFYVLYAPDRFMATCDYGSGIDTDYIFINKLVSRVIVLTARRQGNLYYDVSISEDYEEEIDISVPPDTDPCEGAYIRTVTSTTDSDYFGVGQSHLQKTIWYAICTTPNPPFYSYCNYIFRPTGTGDHYRITMTWNGIFQYMSPVPSNGFFEIAGCCAVGSMIAISEIVYAPGNNRDPEDPSNTHQYRIFIEGTEVYTGEVTPLYERERIAVFDCCGTHWERNQYTHRYALLGTGDVIEEADIGDDTMTLTDGTVAIRYVDENEEPTEYFVTEDGVRFIPNEVLAKKTITDTRVRRLFHNGAQVSENKRYDGLYCCGEYALCTYVDDDYLSGWKDERESGETIETDRKWTAHPNWGDNSPPAARNREQWDDYRSVYPGFAVDVFHAGTNVGTLKLSDANSPMHFDRLGMGAIWLIRAVRDSVVRHSIGNVPWSLEGAPVCHVGKLLIPFDGGLTTCVGDTSERRVFS